MQGVGYAISLAGFFLYNYIKMQKSGPAHVNPGTARHGSYVAVSDKDAEAEKGHV